MEKIIKVVLASLLIAIAGCEQGDFLQGSSLGKVSTTNHDIIIPDGLDTKVPTGDFDGTMVFAGSTNIPASSKTTDIDYKKMGVGSDGLLSKTTPTSRDMAAFIAERPALSNEVDAEEVLDSIDTQLQVDADILVAASTSRKIFPEFNAVNAIYEITLGTPLQPSEFIFRLANMFGVNVIGGSVINNVAPLADEPFETNFRLQLGVIYFSATDIIIVAVLTPSDISSNYSHLADQLSSSTVVTSPNASLSSTSQSFTAQAGGGEADFLFVIDNSGSMSDEQTAVSDAATAFGNAINNSGLNFQIGIIATDSDVLRDSAVDGGFTTSITEFSTDIILGTGGSATETGIYFAERSLQSITAGDAADGTVTVSGHPRSNASLSVVILSD